ncbi:hypothetical protein L7F22_060863 [Adiantum nelumboides]|nr:hypothetical protein [Adiantum nelumboides]
MKENDAVLKLNHRKSAQPRPTCMYSCLTCQRCQPGSSQHEEEGQVPAPGALDVRVDITQSMEDMPEGPSKEFLLNEKKVIESVALAFLQPEEQVKGFGGAQHEDITAWFCLVEYEFVELELSDDESQADYAWQGLLCDAYYLYSMLSEDEQWSWQSMKRALFLAFYDPPELFCTIENGSQLIESWRELQAQYWESLEISAYQVCLPHDGLGSDMHADIVTFHDEGYESDEEASSCSYRGETVDDELKSTESTSYLSSDGDDMEVMHEEASGLSVAKDIYDVYKNASEINSQQEGGQGLVSHEECVQPVEGLFNDGVDDIGFFDSLMLEASDDVSFSSSLDTGMLENVTCELFDFLLDEEMCREKIMGASWKNDACANVSNVFRGWVCLFARMYALQFLLKAAFIAHDDASGVFKTLECNIPYVGQNMVFCAEDNNETRFMMHKHVDGRLIDGFFGIESGVGLVNLLMHEMQVVLVWDLGGRLHLFQEALIFPFDPAREWDMAPYEAHDLSTNEKSHILDEVLAQIPAHIFIAKFRDEEGDNIKTTIMPKEIWTLHRRPEVSSAVRAVHLQNFFRLPPWGTDYMRAHELMSSIQYDGKAMITDNDGEKVEVLITKDIINEALHFIPGAYDLIPKTKAIDNEKAFLKVKGSKFNSSEEEQTKTDKEQDSQESAPKEVPKEVGPSVSSEYESDEEDTSVPLERKSQKPRSQEQLLLDEAMTRVEARRKELAKARAAKAARKTRPMMMDEAKKIKLEKAKAIQKERRRIEAEQKAQEEAEKARAAQTQETEVVDLSGTIEYLKKLEREKHTAEQRAAQLAREKIKEALSRKAEEPVLEPTQGSPKRPRQEEEEEIEDIQADPIPPSPINIPPAPPSSPITPFPPASTPQTPPSPSPFDIPLSPPAPISPQQHHLSAEPTETPAPITEETHQPMEASPQKETAQPMEKIDEEKQLEREQHQPAKVDVPILMVQDEEPSSQEAILEVRSFDYAKLIQTLSSQFQCQQVVAKETEIQKNRAN